MTAAPVTMLGVVALCFSLGCTGRKDRLESARAPLCEPEVDPAPPSNFPAAIPEHFLRAEGSVAFNDNSPSTNPVTDAGVLLGRVLFYDTRLSLTNTVSCGSCHRQQYGFGDTARFSLGVNGHRTRRHSMALANARFNERGRFGWDEHAASLEEQVLVPLTDTLEMAMPTDSLPAKLRTGTYPVLFARAFGSPDITTYRIARALAQFVRALVSSNSQLDAVFNTDGAPRFELLTTGERAGRELFRTVGCRNCHRTVSFFADRANNIGLDRVAADTGGGSGRFKPPSLRNVAVRPPYMHDGRFRTLRQVVEFYSSGIQPNRDLDPRLRNSDGTPRRLNLDSAQIRQLVAYLGTLTDSAFLKDQRFENPFPCRR